MTGSFPTPTWGHIDAFCNADGWSQVRVTDHYHWEKVLPSGELLKTHRSMAADKVIKPGVFGAILRDQLKVSKAEFWQAIETGKPVDRPVDLDEPAAEYPAWVVFGLARFGYSEDDVRAMTPTDAEALLHEKWSQPT